MVTRDDAAFGGWRVLLGFPETCAGADSTTVTSEVFLSPSMAIDEVVPFTDGPYEALSTTSGGLAAFRRASGRFPEESAGWGKSKSMSIKMSSSPDRPNFLVERDREAAVRAAAARLGRVVPPPALLAEAAPFCGQSNTVYTQNDQ